MPIIPSHKCFNYNLSGSFLAAVVEVNLTHKAILGLYQSLCPKLTTLIHAATRQKSNDYKMT